MDWLKWLIPVVVVAVWILSHLAAEQQARQKPAAPRPKPPRDPKDDPSPRRASQELEKFLEEAKRRRQVEEAAEPVYVAQEIPIEPAPRPRPVEKRRSTAIGSKPSQRRADPVIVREQLSVPPAPRSVAMPAVSIAAPPSMPAPPPPPAVPHTMHRPEVLSTKTALPPAAKLVRDLLKSRQSLRAAFLLREIIDEPLCKRRRS